MTEEQFRIRPVTENDKEWVSSFLAECWGSTRFVTRGRMFFADDNPGFIAVKDDKPVGLITYEIQNGECEITSLNSLVESTGIGTALIEAAMDAAQKAGCRRLWLITTNDNTHALRFYQKRGMTITAVYPNAVEKSRALKPEIPFTGEDGIPIRDEIELELLL